MHTDGSVHPEAHFLLAYFDDDDNNEQEEVKDETEIRRIKNMWNWEMTRRTEADYKFLPFHNVYTAIGRRYTYGSQGLKILNSLLIKLPRRTRVNI